MQIPTFEIVKNSTKEIHNFLGISEAILSVWKLIHRCECLRTWSEYNFRLKKCLNFSKIADFKHWFPNSEGTNLIPKILKRMSTQCYI